MSDDEGIVTLLATLLGPVAWAIAYFRLSRITTLRRGRWPILTQVVTILSLGFATLALLRFGAADDVREAPDYLYMYSVMGMAWLRLMTWGYPALGVNSRDDIVERRNVAAAIAWVGACIGFALCYGGANIGNGPGWWVVVFCAVLAALPVVVAWYVLGQFAGLGDRVAIDRDVAAAMRLAGVLVAVGLIAGSAVAGDWVSELDTIRDLMINGWAIGPLFGLALVTERIASMRRGTLMGLGVAPAVAYVGLAVMSALWLKSPQ